MDLRSCRSLPRLFPPLNSLACLEPLGTSFYVRETPSTALKVTPARNLIVKKIFIIHCNFPAHALIKWAKPSISRRPPTVHQFKRSSIYERNSPMTKATVKSLLMTAAISGLLTGATTTLSASTASTIRALPASPAPSASLPHPAMTTRRPRSTLVKARTPAKAKAAASPATTDAKARTPARARAAALPMAPSPRLFNQHSTQARNCPLLA